MGILHNFLVLTEPVAYIRIVVRYEDSTISDQSRKMYPEQGSEPYSTPFISVLRRYTLYFPALRRSQVQTLSIFVNMRIKSFVAPNDVRQTICASISTALQQRAEPFGRYWTCSTDPLPMKNINCTKIVWGNLQSI